MRLLIRVDGDARMGGGHVMRCLTLAGAAAKRGWEVSFVTSAYSAGMGARIRAAGFHTAPVMEGEVPPDEQAPPHAHWLRADWQSDAAATGAEAARCRADWLIWDHYGLDARWVDAVREFRPEIRVLALDDLDDRALGSDLLLDQTRLDHAARHHPVTCAMTGPDYALLRPEFAESRPASLARRDGAVRRVIVMPGMMDAAGLAPMALNALRNFPDLQAEVVMGRGNQSADAVAALCAENPMWTYTPEPPDMAACMVAADLCIGAAGMTGWERCCLGLPTVAVAVADNQRPSLQGLADAGAVVALTLENAQSELPDAIRRAMADTAAMSARAATLCDGGGADRVLDAMDARLRPVRETDAQTLFDWRNQPHIRAVSLDQSELVWDEHLDWVRGVVTRDDGLWMIYREGGRDLGHVNARPDGDGLWKWGFYIGAPDAPKGAGTRMLAAFLDHLQGRGIHDIGAEVRVENAPSIALHRKLGFVVQGAERAGVLAFCLTMGETG